jgi:hypothetical protein
MVVWVDVPRQNITSMLAKYVRYTSIAVLLSAVFVYYGTTSSTMKAH